MGSVEDSVSLEHDVITAPLIINAAKIHNSKLFTHIVRNVFLKFIGI